MAVATDAFQLPSLRSRTEAATLLRAPDFFLVGAPKCGTTALYSWLKGHPQVFMPDHKEPHYFGSDLEFRNRDPLRDEEYAALFEDAGDERRVGEGSTFYLYSRKAAREIFRFNPEARIVAMLRNPVDAMYSLHSERLFGGNEDIASFEEALAAAEDRRQGRRIPAGVRLVDGLFYREVMSFSEQVARYFDLFGRERVHVVLYDDFKRDNTAAFEGVCRFLDVDPGFRPAVSVVNGNKTTRSNTLRNLVVNRRHAPGRRLLRSMVPRAVRQSAYRSAVRLNTVHTPREHMKPETREKLNLQMQGEVSRLSEILGRDLRHWVR